jgi:hypothetical protein
MKTKNSAPKDEQLSAETHSRRTTEGSIKATACLHT